MARHTVRAGKSVLEGFAARPALDALVELIWNGLDAEADKVVVRFETSSLGDGGAERVSRVWVEDNGHGIEPATAIERFTSLGDSWKVGLSGRTLNDERVLHGRSGRGRFYAYALGYSAVWKTAWRSDDGSLVEYQIDGSRSAINEFGDSTPRASERDQTGTTVEIRVDQGRPLTALLDEELPSRLAARFATHLIGNPDLEIRVSGVRLDPRPLIAKQLEDVPLSEVPIEDLHGHGPPLLRIIEWQEEVRSDMPAVVLCNEGGAALAEIDQGKKKRFHWADDLPMIAELILDPDVGALVEAGALGPVGVPVWRGIWHPPWNLAGPEDDRS